MVLGTRCWKRVHGQVVLPPDCRGVACACLLQYVPFPPAYLRVVLLNHKRKLVGLSERILLVQVRICVELPSVACTGNYAQKLGRDE